MATKEYADGSQTAIEKLEAKRAGHFVLGPIFEDPSATQYLKDFPAHPGERLLFRKGIPTTLKYKPAVVKRHWAGHYPEWNDWVKRMSAAKETVWKELGIYDAVLMSTVHYPYDTDFLHAALHFWSRSTNYFHFSFRMMGPTLLDIGALLGLKSARAEINDSSDCSRVNWDLNLIKNASYTSYLYQCRKLSGPVSKQEYVAFLLSWIYHCLICTRADKITKAYLGLANTLASGRLMNLAAFVLSSLYRGCNDLVESSFAHGGGSFWVLQLWLSAYFPEFNPTPLADEFPAVGFKLLRPRLLHSATECFNLFFHLKDVHPSASFTPFHYFNSLSGWLGEAIANPVAHGDLWGSYLTCRDLHYGVFLEHNKNSMCSTEPYNPQFLAR
ncbi:uncharacterized protein LOC122663018 [Telopea speciosissima]|uniref:uncharacterized protein LOC122663018 n=1 Tax=Telopea speciosissima TaxID=54955 RepID=UPI001CC6CA60|nr:uncharacterized protein LOC122663018 [Telopea speciosissima]